MRSVDRRNGPSVATLMARRETMIARAALSLLVLGEDCHAVLEARSLEVPPTPKGRRPPSKTSGALAIHPKFCRARAVMLKVTPPAPSTFRPRDRLANSLGPRFPCDWGTPEGSSSSAPWLLSPHI